MNDRTYSCIIGSALLLMAAASPAQPVGADIENAALKVRYISSGGYFSVISKQSQRSFISFGSFNSSGALTITNIVDKTFGRGQAMVVSHPDGSKDWIMLFPDLPFALFRSSLHNAGNEATVTRKVKMLTTIVDLGRPASELKTLSTGGLLAADKNPGSYAWLAVADPQTRNGVVFGWLTEDRGSGVLFSDVQSVVNHGPGVALATNEQVGVQAQIDYGRLRLAPGKSAESETLAIGYFDDARIGLETWADTVAKVYDIHLPPQPVGYCTWYSQPHGGAADEKHLAELAAFSATNLAPFGFSVVQIDDKWQLGVSTNGPKRNFTAHNPSGPYPSGMKAAADNIKSLGMTPGIWFMPFAGTYYDPFFKDHQDWFVKREDGKPFETAWGGACLDMTQPGARAHLRDVASRICRDWGFQYIKIDGLWTGTGTKQQYVNSGYKDDNIGDAVFDNPDKTNIEAYRDGLRLVREAAGKNIFILGCNGPQNMRSYGGAFGLVDAMRVGPDNKAEWKSLLRGPIFGSRHYFLNGRVWYNDPDPVYARTNIPVNHAQLICSWVALSGQLNLSSEWLPGLPLDRLDILRRTMPAHGATARPVDIFENDPPRIWTVNGGGRDVIGLFNWDSAEQSFDVPLERLGLDAKTEYVAFDYWGNKFIPSVRGRLQIAVPGESCVVLAMRPRVNHPQVISTSRHVTQGIVELADENWDGATKTLSGRVKIVGGDACELRILTGANSSAPSVELSSADKAAGVKATLSSDRSLIRVKFESPASHEIAWSVRFR